MRCMETKTAPSPTARKTRRGWEIEPQTPLSPILVSINAAAALLGVCPRTVQNLLIAKHLRARKIGRRTLLSYSELLGFAKRDHVTAAGPQQ